jgi:hypothetical protein
MIALFVEYLLDARYGWVELCLERFGEAPQEVFHEGNSVLHAVEYEGDPRRRPLDYDEMQALFDAADSRVKRIRGQGRKGALTALRDAAVLKTIYAYGTRRTESSRVDLVDLRRIRTAPEFDRFGSITGAGRRSGPQPGRFRLRRLAVISYGPLAHAGLMRSWNRRWTPEASRASTCDWISWVRVETRAYASLTSIGVDAAAGFTAGRAAQSKPGCRTAQHQDDVHPVPGVAWGGLRETPMNPFRSQSVLNAWSTLSVSS